VVSIDGLWKIDTVRHDMKPLRAVRLDERRVLCLADGDRAETTQEPTFVPDEVFRLNAVEKLAFERLTFGERFHHCIAVKVVDVHDDAPGARGPRHFRGPQTSRPDSVDVELVKCLSRGVNELLGPRPIEHPRTLARETGHDCRTCRHRYGAPQRVTFAELDTQATRFAAALQRVGVGRGDRVVIHLENSTAAVVAIFGTLKAGAAFVVVNPTTKPVKLVFTFTPGAGGASATLTGGTTIKRLDFGVGQGEWTDTTWVGNDVDIRFELTLNR